MVHDGLPASICRSPPDVRFTRSAANPDHRNQAQPASQTLQRVIGSARKRELRLHNQDEEAEDEQSEGQPESRAVASGRRPVLRARLNSVRAIRIAARLTRQFPSVLPNVPVAPLHLHALCVVFGDFAEQCGLVGHLPAIAHDHNLRVGRIKIGARGREHLLGGDGADAVAVCFEIIFGQAFEIHVRQLPG